MVGQQSQLQPLYVGTLIADERGLKELSRKMEIIQLEEKSKEGIKMANFTVNGIAIKNPSSFKIERFNVTNMERLAELPWLVI